jgi:hypothetical protein
MRAKLHTAEIAWLALGAAVLAWELSAPENHLLSEGADRALKRAPILTRAAIAITALHLANALPPRIDPYVLALKVLK